MPDVVHGRMTAPETAGWRGHGREPVLEEAELAATWNQRRRGPVNYVATLSDGHFFSPMPAKRNPGQTLVEHGSGRTRVKLRLRPPRMAEWSGQSPQPARPAVIADTVAADTAPPPTRDTGGGWARPAEAVPTMKLCRGHDGGRRRRVRARSEVCLG